MKTIFLAIAFDCTVLHAYQPLGWNGGIEPTPVWNEPSWDVPDETSWNEPTSGWGESSGNVSDPPSWDLPDWGQSSWNVSGLPSWDVPTNGTLPTNWTFPTWDQSNWTLPTWNQSNWTLPTWNQSSWNVSSFNDTHPVKIYGNITNKKGNTMYVKDTPGVDTFVDNLDSNGSLIIDLQTKQTIKNNLRGSTSDTHPVKRYGTITNKKGHTMYVKDKPGVDTIIDHLDSDGPLVIG